jgi:hypothetical protein
LNGLDLILDLLWVFLTFKKSLNEVKLRLATITKAAGHAGKTQNKATDKIKGAGKLSKIF